MLGRRRGRKKGCAQVRGQCERDEETSAASAAQHAHRTTNKQTTHLSSRELSEDGREETVLGRALPAVRLHNTAACHNTTEKSTSVSYHGQEGGSLCGGCYQGYQRAIPLAACMRQQRVEKVEQHSNGDCLHKRGAFLTCVREQDGLCVSCQRGSQERPVSGRRQASQKNISLPHTTTHTHIYIYIYPHIHTHIHILTHTYTYTHTHAHTPPHSEAQEVRPPAAMTAAGPARSVPHLCLPQRTTRRTVGSVESTAENEGTVGQKDRIE
jgi:hypothetical protein